MFFNNKPNKSHITSVQWLACGVFLHENVDFFPQSAITIMQALSIHRLIVLRSHFTFGTRANLILIDFFFSDSGRQHT